MTGRELAEQYRDRVRDRAEGDGLVRDQADFVVIGTGPSGATAAQVLSSAGHEVIMIEDDYLYCEHPKMTSPKSR